VAIALNLVPFADIAFLWFIGVIRDRNHRLCQPGNALGPEQDVITPQ